MQGHPGHSLRAPASRTRALGRPHAPHTGGATSLRAAHPTAVAGPASRLLSGKRQPHSQPEVTAAAIRGGKDSEWSASEGQAQVAVGEARQGGCYPAVSTFLPEWSLGKGE